MNNRNNRIVWLAFVLAVSSHLCLALEGYFTGVQGAYSAGGDVEDSTFGFGAQAGVDITDAFSVELAWNSFSDTSTDPMDMSAVPGASGTLKLDMDAQVIALTARYGTPMSDRFTVYGGAGISYLMVDAAGDAAITFANPELTADQRSDLQPLADYYGITVDELLAAYGYVPGEVVATGSAKVNLDIDNAIGFHLCVGTQCELTDRFSAFAEYRYAFGKIEGTASAQGSADKLDIDEDYNYGLLRVGVNYLF